jgi:branched-chain amino acid transport system permease protein
MENMILQILINGLMAGFIYALVAVGLTLTWGVMDVINFAHGEFLLWGMYAAFGLWSVFALDPVFALPVCAIIIFTLGVLTYTGIIRRVLNASGLTALLATFGLSMVLKNLAQFFFTANYKNVTNTVFGSGRIEIGNLFIIRHDYLAAATGSLVLTILVILFMNKTKTGIAIKATSINRQTAQLMGINTEKIFAITFGLSGACVGSAAALMTAFTPITPNSCTLYSVLAFVIVALGGFGKIKGALFAGLLVGLVEAIGGYQLGTEWKYAVVFGLYLIVMQVRPKGLFGW